MGLVKMKIRHFRDSDAEQIVKLVNQVTKQVNSQDYSEKQIEALTAHDPDSIVEFANRENIFYIVALEDDEIVGAGNIDLDNGEVKGIFVHPEHLRKGLGTSLLKKMEEKARNSNLEKLHVNSTITAKEFYESRSFEVVEETTQETNGVELQTYKMEKTL